MEIKTILEEVVTTLVIEKSKFISYLIPVESKNEANEALEKLRKKHFDATHVCYAYIVNDEVTLYKSSDDGEPSQTAGAPILNVLRKNELSNVLCAVVRYFGGIKLGAGGLTRAYSNSAIEAVNASTIVTLVDAYDDSFFSSISKSLFVFQDPDAGAIGTKMIRTQVLIDKFESLLYSDNSNDNNKAIELINKESFIDWMIFNEIAKNENAFSKDCYLNISTENIISMGPIWDMSDYFGLKSNDSHEDFVVINHGWAKQLLKDMSFSTSLHQRFQVIYNQKNAILNWIDEEAKKKLPSAFSNELLHNNFDEKSNNYSSFSEKYLEEVEQLKLWIDARLEWLNTALR